MPRIIRAGDRYGIFNFCASNPSDGSFALRQTGTWRLGASLFFAGPWNTLVVYLDVEVHLKPHSQLEDLMTWSGLIAKRRVGDNTTNSESAEVVRKFADMKVGDRVIDLHYFYLFGKKGKEEVERYIANWSTRDSVATDEMILFMLSPDQHGGIHWVVAAHPEMNGLCIDGACWRGGGTARVLFAATNRAIYFGEQNGDAESQIRLNHDIISMISWSFGKYSHRFFPAIMNRFRGICYLTIHVADKFQFVRIEHLEKTKADELIELVRRFNPSVEVTRL